MITQVKGESFHLEQGDASYGRAMLAVFLAGVAAFISLYCAQGLLPAVSHAFQVKAGVADLSVALTTGLLAIAILPISALSEQFGRQRVVICSAVASTIVAFIVPLSPNIYFLLTLRALQGIALAGVPAVVMAYISEEFSPGAMSKATGLYIAGTGFGGLVGRLVPASLVGDVSWNIAWLSSSILTAFATMFCWRLMPESRHFHRVEVNARHIGVTLLHHLKNSKLVLLYIFGFLIMGAYVSYYNLLPYHMQGQPLNISLKQYSLMFLVNIFAIAASWWAGLLIQKYGRSKILIYATIIALFGAVISFSPDLVLLILGSIFLTIGVFSAHPVASSWVGYTATEHRAQASSLYMCAFYGGNSLISAIAGGLYGIGGWTASNTYVTIIFALSLLVGAYIILKKNNLLTTK